MDVCFRRKRTGTTSWSLICAALVNVIALLIISPLSSALLTSEEILVPKSIEFTRIIPKADNPLPIIATRETYFRTMASLMRNTSTSAWVNDTSLAFPFWPSSEVPQLGPNLTSSYDTWKTETTALRSTFECQNMTLERDEMNNKRYSKVYSVQGYGPYNGTQPMVTFVLKSGDGCRYELTMHPLVDLAYNGGVTWSNASTFYPTDRSTLAVGGKVIAPNVTSTHMFARVNSSQECDGRDIIIISIPWTAPVNFTQKGPFSPENATFERSPAFRMRGLLCDSNYSMSKQSTKAKTSGGLQSALDISRGNFNDVPKSIINVSDFQTMSMRNDWRLYFDYASMQRDAKRAAAPALGSKDAAKFPGFSGMAPLLAALSGFSLISMIDDPSIAQTAARIKGRFFMETIREALSTPELVQTEKAFGEATIAEERVVVLTEIGIILSTLFFASFILLVVVFWSSRLTHRPLNLQSDPASTVGLSLLIEPSLTQVSTFRSMHNAPRSDLYTALQKERYLTTENAIRKGNTEFAFVSPKMNPKRDWRPRVIHVRMLLALCILLVLVMIGVLVLNAFSARSRLSQTAFIYEANISRLGLSFSKFAPISIVPTVISVVIGLWWDQLDMTFRILQPYISMSHGPTPIYAGAGLTYRSKSWVGAAFKAARYRHWVLFMVTIGSVLAQILTVSMSALFERQPRNVVHQITLQQNLEIRQVPLITEVNIEEYDRPAFGPGRVIQELYLDASKNWLYGAGIQHSFNGTQLPWTYDGWSFVPLDISNSERTLPSESDAGELGTALVNLTVDVPAIRARLECSPIEEIANVSSWLQVVNLTDPNQYPNLFSEINQTGSLQMYTLPVDMFAGTNSYTTTLSSGNQITCCANGTTANPQRAAMGYWSPVRDPNSQLKHHSFPYQDMPWPLSFTPKLIVGNPVRVFDINGYEDFKYRDIPRIQAAHCQPIIEKAEASVMIDIMTAAVHLYRIKGAATTVDSAWTDVFIRHEPLSQKNSRPLNASYVGPLNITTSFGVLFLDSLLGSADRRSENRQGTTMSENWEDNGFVFRDPERGVNMDLMTYSMYTLANKDPGALLNYTTLVSLADRTFQSFFQHFVNSGLSLKDGSYGYQKINDQSMDGLRKPNDPNVHLSRRNIQDSQTNRTVDASVSKRIRVLHMNTVATYLSTAILAWLMGTTCIIVLLQRRYTNSMLRDVQLIADMLVLVAGSDNFLELVQDNGVALKRNRNVKTMLGWFKDRDGEVRWGIEVVGGRNAVEWVDAPKQGWHLRDNAFFSGQLLPWKRGQE